MIKLQTWVECHDSHSWDLTITASKLPKLSGGVTKWCDLFLSGNSTCEPLMFILSPHPCSTQVSAPKSPLLTLLCDFHIFWCLPPDSSSVIFLQRIHPVSLPPSQATGIPSQHILVAVLPGLPTAAELFVLPYQDGARENKRSPEDLEQVSYSEDISNF